MAKKAVVYEDARSSEFFVAQKNSDGSISFFNAGFLEDAVTCIFQSDLKDIIKILSD